MPAEASRTVAGCCANAALLECFSRSLLLCSACVKYCWCVAGIILPGSVPMPPAAAAGTACSGAGLASRAGGIIRKLLSCNSGCCIIDGRPVSIRLAPAETSAGPTADATLQGGCLTAVRRWARLPSCTSRCCWGASAAAAAVAAAAGSGFCILPPDVRPGRGFEVDSFATGCPFCGCRRLVRSPSGMRRSGSAGAAAALSAAGGGCVAEAAAAPSASRAAL